MRKILAAAGTAMIGATILFGLSVLAQSQTKSAAQDTGVKYQVTPSVTSKAMTPTPSPNATQQSKKSTIGKDKAMVKTSKDNSFWVEEIDVDGSGNPVESQMLWDDSSKVLYTYADKPFQCADGSSGNGDFLIATFGKGNPAKKPAGSGWWIADLDKNECKARTDEMFGCRYDANGKNTACGVATINEKNNDLMIITATTTRNQ